MSEKIVQLNEEIIKGQIKELVRGSVEKTLNELLEKEAESLTQAARYERSEVKSTKTIRMSLSRAGGCSRSAPSENAAVETRFQGRWQDSAYPIWLLRQLLAAFRRERFRPDAEPSNEVPAKSAGVRRLFYECSRSPLKPAF